MLYAPVITPSQRAAINHHKQMMRPANAVPDSGIDLKRKPEPEPKEAVVLPFEPAVKVDVLAIVPEPTRDCSILPPSPSLNDVITRVARYYGMTREELMLKKRIPALVWRRYVAAYFCIEATKKPVLMVAREFKLDHTTVLHGYRKIERLRATDADARREIEHVGFALGLFTP